jgi:hypothetical protein
MANKLRLALGVLLLFAFGYLGYVNLPRVRQRFYTVTKMTFREVIKPFTTTIMIDGQPREVTVQVPYTEYVPSADQAHTRDILPTAEEYFRFGIICLGTVAVFWYIAIVMLDLHRIKKAGGKSTASSRDTEKRADKIVTFVFGLILGFVGAGGELVKKPTSPPADETPGPYTLEAPRPDKASLPTPAPSPTFDPTPAKQ